MGRSCVKERGRAKDPQSVMSGRGLESDRRVGHRATDRARTPKLSGSHLNFSLFGVPFRVELQVELFVPAPRSFLKVEEEGSERGEDRFGSQLDN